MELFLWPFKIAVFSKKNTSPPHKKESGETLGETFFSQNLMYMENTNVSFGKFAKFRPLGMMLPKILER